MTHCTRPAPEPAALLARISDAGFDPLVESFVEGDAALGTAGDAPRGTPATIVVDEERVVEIEANRLTQPSFPDSTVPRPRQRSGS